MVRLSVPTPRNGPPFASAVSAGANPAASKTSPRSVSRIFFESSTEHVMEPALPTPEPLSAYVRRAQELYTLPAVALQVLELTESPQVDARALKRCIETDPALAARLLRVVNSSLFGLSRQVSDLNQALALLGVTPLKVLVLGFCLPQGLFVGLRAETLTSWWRRTLVKAAASRSICEAAGERNSDEAFLAGLLQDLGQLALVQDLGEPYIAFLDRARRERGDLATRELVALGFDHAMFSARLLDHWGLPQPLVQAIAQRQDIEHLASLPEPTCRLPQTLHLAELAARLLADEQPAALPELHRAAQRYKNLSPPQIEMLLRSLHDTMTALAEALDIDGCSPLDCDQILERAKAQQAVLAAAAIDELERAFEETRLWQEAESLRQAAADFLTRQSDTASGISAPPQKPNHGVGGSSGAVRNSVFSASRRPTSPPVVPSLTTRVALTVANARQRRAPVSLLAIGRDRDRDGVIHAADVRPRVLRLMIAVAESLSGPWGVCVECNDDTVALVLEDCDRLQAVSLARQLVETVARCAAARAEWFGGPVTISVGAATLALPPRNFPPEELIEAAWRCLSGAQVSGGNTVKSIDI